MIKCHLIEQRGRKRERVRERERESTNIGQWVNMKQANGF